MSRTANLLVEYAEPTRKGMSGALERAPSAVLDTENTVTAR